MITFSNGRVVICYPICENLTLQCIFGKLDFCISKLHIPKAFFCGKINAVYQIDFDLQG